MQVGANLLIGAFRVAGDALEVLLDVGVVVNLEVVGGVDVPLEVVVVDVVLAEVGNKRRLGGSGPGQRRQEQRGGDDRRSAHKQYLGDE